MSLTTRVVIVAAALAALALSLVISHDLYQQRMIAMLTSRQESVLERKEAVVQHLERSNVGLHGLHTWRATLDPQTSPDEVLDSLAHQEGDWAADLHDMLSPMIDHLVSESALDQAAQARFLHDYLEKFEQQWARSLLHDQHEQTATIRAALSNIAEDIDRRRAALYLLSAD